MTLPVPRFQDDSVTLYHGDALALLPEIPTATINLIVCDPPYYKVKMDYLGHKLQWDRQWPTREAYLAWLRQLAKEWQRVLAPNGSLYCFAAPQMAAHVEVMLEDYFTVLNRMTWLKEQHKGRHKKVCKEDLRTFFPVTESILFCEQHIVDSMTLGESGYASKCEHLHGHVFEPIRAYLDGERLRAEIDKSACNEACGFAAIAGGMASRHYFSRSQWWLPTQTHYKALQTLFNTYGQQPPPPFTTYHPTGSTFARFHIATPNEYLCADYEALRADYEALRRPFAVTEHIPYTDVWSFDTVHAGAGKHPCEKPLPLLRHIIEVSSRHGDFVLDCCVGSGATLEAARQCGRRAIGIELEEDSINLSIQRLSQQQLPWD